MKSIGRAVKSLTGWLLALFFGVVGIYALFDETVYDLGMIVICLGLAAVGAWMIVSAARDKKRTEARLEEEERYRRQQAAEEKAYTRREEAEAVPFVTVACPGCGAVGRVRRNGTARCEYCGTVLNSR